MIHSPISPSFRRLAWTFLFLSITAFATARAQDRDSTAVADSLAAELAREMGEMEQPPPPTPTGQVARGSVTTNPNVSVIGDFRAWYESQGSRNVDLEMHEAEFSFISVVDPYARAEVYVSAGHQNGAFEFELEEGFIETLSLPYRLQAKIGKFRSNVGKINQIHPHALPFIDVPAVYANYFGEEGLNDQGIAVSWLVPNDAFYQELTAEVSRGPGEGESFVNSGDNRLLYSAHLKNFWDLSADATLEVGLTGIAGPNTFDENTLMGGLDVTYKWKPVRYNTYHSLTLQTETFLSSADTGPGGRVTTMGLYALGSYQLARRWFLTGRFDQSDLPNDPSWNEKGVSLTLGWYLSEFQKIELGARSAWADAFDQDYQALLRAVFVIGTHGAHAY